MSWVININKIYFTELPPQFGLVYITKYYFIVGNVLHIACCVSLRNDNVCSAERVGGDGVCGVACVNVWVCSVCVWVYVCVCVCVLHCTHMGVCVLT